MGSLTKSCPMTYRLENSEQARVARKCWRKLDLASQSLRDLALPTGYRLCDVCCLDAGSIREPRTD